MSNKQIYSLLAGLMGGLAAKKYMKDSEPVVSGSMAKKKRRPIPFVGPEEQKGLRPSVSDKFDEDLWNSQMEIVTSTFDWSSSLRGIYKEALLYCMMIEETALLQQASLENSPDFSDYLDLSFIPYIRLKIRELELVELHLNSSYDSRTSDSESYFLDIRSYLSKVEMISDGISNRPDAYNSFESRISLLNEFYEKYAMNFNPGLLVGTASIGFSSALRLGHAVDKCGYDFFSRLELELDNVIDTMKRLGLSLIDNSIYNLALKYNFATNKVVDIGACFIYSVNFLALYFKEKSSNLPGLMMDFMSTFEENREIQNNSISRIISSKSFNKSSGFLLNTGLEVGPVVKSTGPSGLDRIHSSLPGADRYGSKGGHFNRFSKSSSVYRFSNQLKKAGRLNESYLSSSGLKNIVSVLSGLESLTLGPAVSSPSAILREARYPDILSRSEYLEKLHSRISDDTFEALLLEDICFFDEPVPIESILPKSKDYESVMEFFPLVTSIYQKLYGSTARREEVKKHVDRITAMGKLYFNLDPTINAIYRLANAGQNVIISDDERFIFNHQASNIKLEGGSGLYFNLPSEKRHLNGRISLIGYHLEIIGGKVQSTRYDKFRIKFIIKLEHFTDEGTKLEDIVFFPLNYLFLNDGKGKTGGVILSAENLNTSKYQFPTLAQHYANQTGGGEALGASGVMARFSEDMSTRDIWFRDLFFDIGNDSEEVLPGLMTTGFVLGCFKVSLIDSLPKRHFFSDSCYYPNSEYDKKIGPARDARLLRQEQSRQRQAEAQAERQRQRQAEAQAERQRQRQAEEQAERQRQRQADAQAERQRQRQAEEQAERQRQRQADAQAERQRQRQAEAQAERQRQRQANLQAQRQRQRQSEAQRIASQQQRGKQFRPWMKGYPGLDYSRLIRLHSDKMSAQQKYHYENEKFEAVFEARTPLENRRFVLPEHYTAPAPYVSTYECLRKTIGIIQSELNPSEPWQWRVLCSMKELCSNLMMKDINDPDFTDPRRVIRPWSNYHRIYNISKFSDDIMESAYSHSHTISNFNCFWPTTLNSSVYLDLEIMGLSDKIAYMCGESITGYPPGEVIIKSTGRTKLMQIFIGTIGSDQYVDFLVFSESIHFESSGQNFSIENYCFTYRMYVSGEFGHGQWIDQSPFDDSSIQQELGALWITLVAIFRNRKSSSHFIRIPMLSQEGKYDLSDEDLASRKRRIAAEERARLERRINAAKKRGIPDMFSSSSEMALTSDKTGVVDPLQVYVPSNAVKNQSGDALGPTWSPPKMSARYVKQQNIFGDDLSRQTAVVVQDEESALSHIEQVNFQSMKLKDFPYLLNWPKNDSGGRNPHEDSRIFLLQSSVDQAIIDEDRFIWSKVESSRPRRYYRVPKEVEGWILMEDGTVQRFTYPYLLITDIT